MRYLRWCYERDRAENVSFSYDGKNQILDSVNAAMSYGEVNLIAGHSVEGKSTSYI